MLKLRYFVIALCALLLALPVLAQDAPTVGLGSTEELGDFLVGPTGMTLYLFTPDPLNTTVCSGRCLEAWPALTVESEAELTKAEGIPGTLGVITREDDGTMQVTYNGIPLYYWFRDANPGDTTGNGVGNDWWVVAPSTISIQYVTTIGWTLVGPTGMTLYTFDNDAEGVSNCTEGCAAAWPPVTVESAEAATAGVNLVGEIGTIERADGTLQVTYNGKPLYHFAGDMAVGDTNGEGSGGVWHTVAPEVAMVSNTADLGDFLVYNSGRTMYIFANDTEGVSNCADTCLENWPPVIVFENDRLIGTEGVAGEFGTITRDDGKLQLTYNGMPLYLFKDDKAVGDTNGQGVGGVWMVVAP